jgi:hypothetical protein
LKYSGKPGEILEVKPEREKIPALSIADLCEAQGATSQSSTVRLQEFITRLMSKTTAPVAPFIEVSGEGKEKKFSYRERRSLKRINWQANWTRPKPGDFYGSSVK